MIDDDVLTPGEVLDDGSAHAGGLQPVSQRRSMPLRTDPAASTVIHSHAFVDNLRRGHYELGVEARHVRLRVAATFDELTEAI